MGKKPESVNDPFPRMTDAELVENLAYWKEKSATAPKNGAAGMAADKFAAQIEREIDKRKNAKS